MRTLEADMPKKDKQPKEECPPAFTLEGWLQLAEREVLPRLRELFDR